MQPVLPSPAVQGPRARLSRWERLRRSWRLLGSFIPPVALLSGLILHVRPNSAVGSLLNVAMYAFYAILLARPLWSTMKANPGVWRLRVVRRILAGTALSIAATICWAVTTAISGQRDGTAQVILVVTVFASYCFIFLALFVGLLDASKGVIARYQSEHSGSSRG